MANPSNCYAHYRRQERMNKVHYLATFCPQVRRLFQPLLILSGIKLAARQEEPPDENLRFLISGVETSLKELEDNYERKPEWQKIKEGGVLSVPLEELRMQNPRLSTRLYCTVYQAFAQKGHEGQGANPRFQLVAVCSALWQIPILGGELGP